MMDGKLHDATRAGRDQGAYTVGIICIWEVVVERLRLSYGA